MAVALEDGAISEDGRVWGTYLHDIFILDEVRQPLLDQLRSKRGLASMPVLAADILNQELDRLAEHLEAHLDMDALLAMLKLNGVES
jgi:adenosylcobyric acid synthase